ncbi:MAG: hypothetical protein U9P70_05020 [Patescibacteria group bacterium]|nr:hypothetical protein [Patescibacteria group bacterium]
MKKFFILIFILILLPVSLQATGIQVSPSKIDFILGIGCESVSEELIVANPTADIQIFEVYPDEFYEIIKTNPASFTLEAGERKVVTVTVYSSITENISQVLKTNLSVVSKPLIETRLQANTGVKIPLSIVTENIIVKNKSHVISPKLFYAILIVVAFGFGFITYLIFKRNRKQNNYPRLEN